MRFVTLVLLLGAALAACEDDTELRLAQLGYYDDFPGSTIDTAKWTVDTTGGGTVGVGGGVATLALNTAGGDMQSTLEFPVSLPGVMGTFSTRVTVLSYTEGGGSNVRYRIFLRPYKDNKYAGATLTSDIFAQLRLRAGQWQAMVSRCIDAACSSEVIFGPTVLGAGALGQSYLVTLTWNGASIFGFEVEGLGATSFDATEGTYVPVGPSGSPRAKLEVIATSGAPTTGQATALVDYVICRRTNGSPC